MKPKILRQKFQEANPKAVEELFQKRFLANIGKPKPRVSHAQALKRNERLGSMSSSTFRMYSVKNRHYGRKSATSQLRTMPQNKVEQKVNAFIQNKGSGRVTKEELAHKIGCRVHQVALVFASLNRQGILGQAQRSFAPDSKRNAWDPAPESGWAANQYSIL